MLYYKSFFFSLVMSAFFIRKFVVSILKFVVSGFSSGTFVVSAFLTRKPVMSAFFIRKLSSVSFFPLDIGTLVVSLAIWVHGDIVQGFQTN